MTLAVHNDAGVVAVDIAVVVASSADVVVTCGPELRVALCFLPTFSLLVFL